ncbi:radial spoke head 10 homolog B isoform X2 [Oreochromis niloticus]|uniref:radial spoke head 10 homolog B isoform X2 n=1 Tax=Oreochromis niloticus TaxID=8128 RepID=UPI0003941FAF|nr:radial spoke head 10 homolog B2 isoform X2 [Oreochromis niloticus]
MISKSEEGRRSEKSMSQIKSHPDSDEQPEEDGNYELPPLIILTVQRYEGETCEGQFHGQGVAYFEGGHVYKGEFVRNIPMGQGTYTWPDGSTFKGEVYNGIRHGTGTYKCTQNSLFYSGQWHQGKRHGKGTAYYNEEKTSWYKGDWVRNNREGCGLRCYPSGNIYSGEWKNNQRHGEGTMRWLNLGQKYVGAWQDGVQHGQGTHVWNLWRKDGSQYSQSNRYTGEFAQGQRHGWGTFYYAGGAIYEGEWKNNKKHGQGKFTLSDGRAFEGHFVDDQMITPNLRAHAPLGAFPLSHSNSSLPGPDMALNIDCLLDIIPERKRDTERKQVEFVVLRQERELRSICSFYSRLGYARSPENTLQLSRLQFWRLLKDCNIHHRGITLTQIDRLIREDVDPAEIHSPFTPVLLRKLVSYLVIVAYHIHSKDMVSPKYLLAACFSKLMTDDILPNAKNVKGFLFRQPDVGVVAMNYMKRCWEVFQLFCTATRDEQTMTCHHLLWMFKDLHLLDHKLTTRRLLEIINAESHDPDNLSASVDLEITFLEFFEVLLGCAEVTCEQVSETLKEDHQVSGSNTETRKDSPEVETGISSAQDGSQFNVKTEANEIPETAEYTNNPGGEIMCRPAENDTKDGKLELKMKTVEFFNHFFFPASDYYQLVTRNKERKAPPRISETDALDKMQQKPNHAVRTTCS